MYEIFQEFFILRSLIATLQPPVMILVKFNTHFSGFGISDIKLYIPRIEYPVEPKLHLKMQYSGQSHYPGTSTLNYSE